MFYMIDTEYVLESIYDEFDYIDKQAINKIFDVVFGEISKINHISKQNPIIITRKILKKKQYDIIKLPKDIEPYKGYLLTNFMPKLYSPFNNSNHINDVILKELETNIKIDYFVNNMKNNGLIIEFLSGNENSNEYIVLYCFVSDDSFFPFNSDKIVDGYSKEIGEEYYI